MSIDNVQDISPRVQYVALAAQTAFDYPFPIFADADLVVDVDGVTLTLTTDYTVSGATQDNGGAVTLVAALSGGEIVTLYRDTGIARTTDMQQNGPWRSSTTNDEFDKVFVILQELEARIGRSLRLPLTAEATDAQMQLSPLANWLGKYVAISALGIPEPADLVAGTISQSVIGALLNPQSSAEAAAAALPTQFYLAYHDVGRFGATGDGSTDDTAACQKALDAARYGLSRVHFPSRNLNGRTVYCVNGLVVHSGTYVTADPGVYLRKNGGTGYTHILDAVGEVGTPIALSANASIGDTTVTVASTTGLAVGALAVLSQEVFAYSNLGRHQEVNEIASITGSGPYTVTLKNRFIRNYTTANTARITPFTVEKRDIVFENIRCEIPAGVDGGGIYVEYGYGCEVRNCYSTGQKDHPGASFWKCAHSYIRGGLYENGASTSTPGFGYGFSIGYSQECHALGVFTRNVRENAISVGSKLCSIKFCHDRSAYDNSFNTHADGNEDCEIHWNTSVSSRGYGILAGFTGSNAADKRISLKGNRIFFSGLVGIWSAADASRENEDIEIELNTVVQPGVRTSAQYGIEVIRGTRPRVRNNKIVGQISNVRAAIRVDTSTAVDLGDNNIADVPGGWGIIHENCTGITISENRIAGIAGGTQGVHATGTASTGVYVLRNRIDNDVAFTRNSGDVHRDNIYSTKREHDFGQAAGVADGGTISHACIASPGYAQVQATVAGEFAEVTSRSSTTITVAIKKHDGTAGTAQAIDWEVRR